MKILKYAFLTALLICSAAAGGVFGGSLFGAGRADAQDGGPLAATAFQVEDSNGAVRIFAGTAEDTSQPAIYLFDANKKPRAIYSLTTANALPHFSMWDKAGKVRLAAAVLSDGSSSFEILDKAEKVTWHKP